MFKQFILLNQISQKFNFLIGVSNKMYLYCVKKSLDSPFLGCPTRLKDIFLIKPIDLLFIKHQ